ncbi:uncharacterized protein TrAFT101_000448 [Trichoderma asperellum]|uniref:uncharacterized protein n=1 Tax=Trichoderma asperellum TaxID=101201 RepID=UPI0033317CE1|nr:hypothetical protein TrAFT101_000448 [Trichoderma asperellum]
MGHCRSSLAWGAGEARDLRFCELFLLPVVSSSKGFHFDTLFPLTRNTLLLTAKDAYCGIMLRKASSSSPYQKVQKSQVSVRNESSLGCLPTVVLVVPLAFLET